MTAWPDGRLPIFVEPVPGEALDSWLETYARRLTVTTHRFLAFLGLRGSSLGRMTQRLSPAEQAVLSRASGLGAPQLRAMTLEPWVGLTVAYRRAGGSTMGQPPAWQFYGSDSRFCPRCLDEDAGRWPLAWRQPWSFACPRHHSLLMERCPECRQPVRAQGTRVGGPSRPGYCTRGRLEPDARIRIRCGFRLDQASAFRVPADGLVVNAQRHVNGLLEAMAGTAQAREKLHDLYALGWRALAGLVANHDAAPAVAGRVLAEVGGSPPVFSDVKDAVGVRDIAIGTTLGRLAAPHPTPVDDGLLQWLVNVGMERRAGASDRSASTWSKSWRNTSPPLAGTALAMLDPGLTLRSRLRYGTASPRPYWRELTDEQIRRRVSSIPGKLWPYWAARLAPQSVREARSADRFREAVVTLALLPGTRLDFNAANALLGHGRIRSDYNGLPSILSLCPPTVLASTIAQLAWALDEHGSPIDYTRRRTLFHQDAIMLDDKALTRLYSDLGWRRDKPSRIALARWHLQALLHGADPAPVAGQHSVHQRFRLYMPAPLRDFLDNQAAANLANHNIDEPVRWEPPGDWADASSWPGVDIQNIDEVLARKTIADLSDENLAASRLQLSTVQFRLYCESGGLAILPATGPDQPWRNHVPGRTRGKSIPRIGHLAPASLTNYYLDQGMTQQQIATLAGCSQSTVTHALAEAGIPLRPRKANGTVERQVPRAWLTEHYLVKGRSAPAIAHELGLHKNVIIRLLRRYDIPRSGHSSNPFAELNEPLSPAMRAVVRTANALQRIHHITQMPGHHNLSAAAAAIGVTPGALSDQLHTVERAAGFTVIARTRPLTATEAGRAFLAEAEHLLELLDGDRRE